MTTIIKILIALLVLTACFNASRVAITNYQFEDSMKEMLLFDPRASDKVIVDKVMKLALDYDLPIDPKEIDIHQSGQDVIVKTSYTVNIKLIPGFARDWTFTPSASTKILTGSRAQ